MPSFYYHEKLTPLVVAPDNTVLFVCDRFEYETPVLVTTGYHAYTLYAAEVLPRTLRE